MGRLGLLFGGRGCGDGDPPSAIFLSRSLQMGKVAGVCRITGTAGFLSLRPIPPPGMVETDISLNCVLRLTMGGGSGLLEPPHTLLSGLGFCRWGAKGSGGGGPLLGMSLCPCWLTPVCLGGGVRGMGVFLHGELVGLLFGPGTGGGIHLKKTDMHWAGTGGGG